MAVFLLGPRMEEVGSELSWVSLLKIFFLSFLLAVLGLRCCEHQAGATLELLSTGFSLRSVGSQHSGFSCPCGMWNLPGPGIEPMSPALAGGFSTTGPPGGPLGPFNKGSNPGTEPSQLNHLPDSTSPNIIILGVRFQGL